jgi:CheY-like chemotaxis protein
LEVGDGQEAIDIANAEERDIILLDYNILVVDRGVAAKILRAHS